jgi:hypothetical protein
MPIYTDNALLLNTEYLVAATVGEGEGPHDGRYWLLVLLDIGGRPKRLWVDYATKDVRDAAFSALRALVVAEAGAVEGGQ